MAYPFQLPELGYAHDALEPHIDARTMEIHHGKHHAGYTNNLNKALEGHPELHAYPADQLLRGFHSLPAEIQTAVRNNGGGYVNHSLFWEIMTPGGSNAPSGALAKAIDGTFGWGWLCVDALGRLSCFATPNQDSPMMQGFTPILGVDVWEHAYYLSYQNRRPDYLKAWWNVVNWDVVADRFAAAKAWVHTG
jgi:Fe-Mn family superoxide dismutase